MASDVEPATSVAVAVSESVTVGIFSRLLRNLQLPWPEGWSVVCSGLTKDYPHEWVRDALGITIQYPKDRISYKEDVATNLPLVINPTNTSQDDNGGSAEAPQTSGLHILPY